MSALHPAAKVLTSDRSSIATGRRWVRRQASSCFGDVARIGDIELAASELLTNAVQHCARGNLTLTCWRAGAAFVFEVSSLSSSAIPQLATTVVAPPPDRPSGRGLFIVATISDRLSLTNNPPHVAARCTFDL